MAKDLKYMMDAKVSAVKVSADQKGGGKSLSLFWRIIDYFCSRLDSFCSRGSAS